MIRIAYGTCHCVETFTWRHAFPTSLTVTIFGLLGSGLFSIRVLDLQKRASFSMLSSWVVMRGSDGSDPCWIPCPVACWTKVRQRDMLNRLGQWNTWVGVMSRTFIGSIPCRLIQQTLVLSHRPGPDSNIFVPGVPGSVKDCRARTPCVDAWTRAKGSVG